MWFQGASCLAVQLLLLSSSRGEEGAQMGTEQRGGRSLLNTFPFSQDTANGLGGRSLVNSFPFSQDTAPASARQGQESINFNDVAEAAATGKRCIDKIIMEERTVYDETYECNHSYDKRCSTSYVTTYNAQQEEECEDNYKKDCFIEFGVTAYNAKVQMCREPLIKDCSVDGPVICTTEYESECETVFHEHAVEDDVVDCRTEFQEKCEEVSSGYTSSQKCSKWPVEVCEVTKKAVSKYSPQTSCNKVPVELCGPSACPAVAGPKECYETTKTIVSDKPEEQCSLEPQRTCKHVTKLVPELKPHESCTDVPKEICTRSESNPRKVTKPVIKKWCYTPSPEAGLGDDPNNNQQGAGGNSGNIGGNECPRTCLDAKRSGVCDPRCNPYARECGIRECQPATAKPVSKCPSSCRGGYNGSFQRNGRCEPQCNNPDCGYDPDCNTPPPTRPPACPASCSGGPNGSFQRNRRCEPQCNIAGCGYDPDCNTPPPTTRRPTTRRPSTRRPVTEKPGYGYLPPPNSCNPSLRSCRQGRTGSSRLRFGEKLIPETSEGRRQKIIADWLARG